jgi:hypothetical protein
MVKLKKLIVKNSDQQWKLYIDYTTTMQKNSDPRDFSGDVPTSSDAEIFRQVTRRPHRSYNPGYIGWDREYIDDNTVAFIHYFDTVENASTYYKNMRVTEPKESIPSKIKIPGINDTTQEKYTIAWYIVDENNNVVPFA